MGLGLWESGTDTGGPIFIKKEKVHISSQWLCPKTDLKASQIKTLPTLRSTNRVTPADDNTITQPKSSAKEKLSGK